MNSSNSGEGYGVYVHIPFCASKCPYCDFVSAVISDERRKSYLAALKREIEMTPYSGSRAESLYLGGGTPSELKPDELETILKALVEAFSFSRQSEWTIECNPNSANQFFLDQAKDSGFHRLSLGIQSFNNRHLEFLGRIHRAADSYQAYESARKRSFQQINVDLIFAIPGQTISEWREDLKAALALGPEHLSLYSLTIESSTQFGRMVESGSLEPPDTDLSADMLELAMDLTAKSGYQHYEISNYCLEGCECRHNLRYWQNQAYLGFGLGASSFADRVRWTNTPDWDHYENSVQRGPVLRLSEEKLAGKEALAEEIMLRLRTRWGLSPGKLSKKYDQDFWEIFGDLVELLRNESLLEIADDHLRLTRRGLLLADEICVLFLQSEGNASSEVP